jgi:hypothetical protein
MNVFDLSPSEGKPSYVADHKIDLLSNSATVKSPKFELTEQHFTFNILKSQIKYNTSVKDEGVLNFYLCRLENGKCYIHVFGKLKTKTFRFEKKMGKYSEAGFIILHDHMGHVLQSSRNILKLYYSSENHRSMENHFMAFFK